MGKEKQEIEKKVKTKIGLERGLPTVSRETETTEKTIKETEKTKDNSHQITVEDDRKSKPVMRWTITYPKLLSPSPLEMRPEILEVAGDYKAIYPMPRFSIRFDVENLLDFNCSIWIYVCSFSQAAIFVLDTSFKKRKGLFRRKVVEENYALDNYIKQLLSPHSTAPFVFHGIYRPKLGLGDQVDRRSLLFLIRIWVQNDHDSKLEMISERRLEIPFERKESIRETKGKKAQLEEKKT